MDPDETLRRIRNIVRTARSEALSDSDAHAHLDVLADHVDDLDEWLGKGGFAPSAWTPANTAFELPRSRRMLLLGMEVSERILRLVDTADEYTRGDLQGATEAVAYDLVHQVFQIAQSLPDTDRARARSADAVTSDLIAKATPHPANPGPHTRASVVEDDRTAGPGVDEALDL